MTATRDLIPEESDVLDRVGDLPVDLAAMAVVANVLRAAQEARAHLERHVLREHDLTWTGFAVLFNLWIWPGPPPRETRDVAASIGVAKSTLTGVVDTLERRGLVARRDMEDRRLRQIELTEAGRSTIVALFPLFNAGESALVRRLDADEKTTLAELLRKIIRGAREEGA
jgi:DNA-binding MarR family transcriptional regulator